ncbi:MAG: branched-chain amino acid ABC transporter permease [Burkholderiaceae bacterium]|nr:branched-chain amino acid ABC transporter permease [Burkholderiaceae bacterium]
MALSPARLASWGSFALVLTIAPLVLRDSLALTVISQMGYLIIICLSYNILLGQGGMLSFGHAVYTGLGSLIAAHTMNLAAAYAAHGGWPVPLALVPLVGGVTSAVCAMLLGYISTKKSGTTFAMITLGIGELVASMALMFPGFFGGEGGVTTDRVYGSPLLGIPGLDFGSDRQVYYLIAVYCFICTLAMYAFTGTPLGRILNAVRDNPERVEFIGYNTRRVRYLAFIIAGFFAGIGGALATVNFEIVNASDSLNMARSGSYLLFTFLGGVGFFFGPIIGAALLVLASVLLSELTKAWLLYLGLLFVFMVMFAPGGIASLLMANLRVARARKLARLALPYLALALTTLMFATGAAALVEMIYHLQLDAALGPKLNFLGSRLDTSLADNWVGATLLLLIGLALFAFARKYFVRAWNDVQEEIEAEIAQREAASETAERMRS